MNADEIRAVAQAITDAHANKPGNDPDGRMDDAKTMIAAFDAIQAFRSAREKKITKAVAVVAEAKIEAAVEAAVSAPDTNVTQIQPKAKGKKA